MEFVVQERRMQSSGGECDSGAQRLRGIHEIGSGRAIGKFLREYGVIRINIGGSGIMVTKRLPS